MKHCVYPGKFPAKVGGCKFWKTNMVSGDWSTIVSSSNTPGAGLIWEPNSSIAVCEQTKSFVYRHAIFQGNGQQVTRGKRFRTWYGGWIGDEWFINELFTPDPWDLVEYTAQNGMSGLKELLKPKLVSSIETRMRVSTINHKYFWAVKLDESQLTAVQRSLRLLTGYRSRTVKNPDKYLFSSAYEFDGVNTSFGELNGEDFYFAKGNLTKKHLLSPGNDKMILSFCDSMHLVVKSSIWSDLGPPL